MDISEVKKLGAPFDRAEIHVSRRNKTARLVLIVGEPGKMPNTEFPILEDAPVEATGAELILAAQRTGLLRANSRCAVVDIDVLEAGTAKA